MVDNIVRVFSLLIINWPISKFMWLPSPSKAGLRNKKRIAQQQRNLGQDRLPSILLAALPMLNALMMEKLPASLAFLSTTRCYVELLPKHSLMFSNVLCSHVTLSHPFRPTRPFEILTSSGFHSLSTAFLHQHHIHHINICLDYHRTISEPFRQSQNVIRSITDILRHFYHLNHASTLRRFQYYTFYIRLYYYSILALSIVV